MYCTHCGKEIADDQQVCPYCGQKTIAYKEENASGYAGNNNGFNQSNANNGYNNNFNGNGGYNHNQNGGYGGNGYNNYNCNGNYNNGYGYQNGNHNYNQNFRPQNFDAPNAGFAVLSFFFPIVGLILYLVWNDQYPLKAKSCGKGALIGVITYFALALLSVILVSCVMCNIDIGGGGIYY